MKLGKSLLINPRMLTLYFFSVSFVFLLNSCVKTIYWQSAEYKDQKKTLACLETLGLTWGEEHKEPLTLLIIDGMAFKDKSGGHGRRIFLTSGKHVFSFVYYENAKVPFASFPISSRTTRVFYKERVTVSQEPIVIEAELRSGTNYEVEWAVKDDATGLPFYLEVCIAETKKKDEMFCTGTSLINK